jgi:hypothetical protein
MILEVLGVLEVMRCLLLCMLESVESKLCLPEVLDVLEGVRYVLLYIGDRGGWALPHRSGGSCEGDILRAACYSRFVESREGWALLLEMLEVK